MSVREASSAENSISASRAERLAAVADPADRLGERLVAVDPELVLEVDVARGDEDVEVRPLGDADRLDGPLRVAVAAAGERGDRDPALRLLGDPADRLEVAGRGGREAGLDDVDLEPGELAGDLELLGGGQPGARRLLAVAQGRVEDPDRAGGDRRSRSSRVPALAGVARSPRRRAGRAWACAGLDDDRVEERHLARAGRAPTCSIWWSLVLLRAAARTPAPPDSLLGDPAVRERAVLDVGQDVLHRRLDALVDDPRARDVVAVLGGVADAEAHEVQAAAVHQVDDQLELVHRLEVGELGLVAGLDERLERRLDSAEMPPHRTRLLAEQVGLGLLLERRLEDAGAGRCRAPRA